MTTKPKTRKAPAKAARETRAKPASGINKIEVLIARWNWLEADQNYRTAIADNGNGDSSHNAEQERIIAKLRKLVPQDDDELTALFRFALDEIKVCNSLRGDGADVDMLSNIHDALFYVLRAERGTARQEGMKNMREFLNKRTGAVFDVATDPNTIERIGWGAA
jgi:hypothetical protein